MNDRTTAFTVLLLVALAIAIFVFFYARFIKGQSRAMAMFLAGSAFGGVLCLCTFFSYTTFLEPPRGMGLERIIFPFAFLIGSVIASLILSLIFYIFGNRKAPESSALSPEAQDILRQASRHQDPTYKEEKS